MNECESDGIRNRSISAHSELCAVRAFSWNRDETVYPQRYCWRIALSVAMETGRVFRININTPVRSPSRIEITCVYTTRQQLQENRIHSQHVAIQRVTIQPASRVTRVRQILRWRHCYCPWARSITAAWETEECLTNQLTNCGAERYWRGHQLCSHSVVSHHLIVHDGSLPRSQELSPPIPILSQTNPVHTIN
jgi:hypothetical protein